MDKYSLSWDKIAIFVTVFCAFAFCGVVFRLFLAHEWEQWLLGAIALVFIVPIFLFPLSMSEDEEQIVLHFIGRDKVLKLSDYESISLKENGMSDMLRTFGSGGYFGYWGKWRGPSRRRYTSYVMNTNKPIYVLIPKDPKADYIIMNRDK